ncbi:hypothetical protein [Amylolactobacillus amylophilus]|uniref:hypothetical protein n=1 Tax=Amylolactobacillus amylophilus TaxID=1603 RepID=UPI000A55348E|nr:hypothetical protein [Amylolactobacillus amylophilus]
MELENNLGGVTYSETGCIFFLIITGISLVGIVSYFVFGKKHRHTEQVQPNKEALEAK